MKKNNNKNKADLKYKNKKKVSWMKK